MRGMNGKNAITVADPSDSAPSSVENYEDDVCNPITDCFASANPL